MSEILDVSPEDDELEQATDSQEAAPEVSTESDILQLNVDTAQAYHRGRSDFNFFAGLCLPDVITSKFPLYYIATWVLLVQAIEENNKHKLKKVLRYVIGLPRGFAKTTFLKVLMTWLIVYDKVSFLLIVCATDPLAEAFLLDLHNILQSANVERVYGKWIPAIDNANTKRGAYHRRVLIIKARGAGTSVRGINEDNKRPDFILCDDMQTKENDASDADSRSLFDWFVGTLLKVVTQKSSVVFYVGNMYSDRCILYKLKINQHWISLITGCILEDGSSLWPELFSIEDLYESFLHDESLGKADIWFAEMMNDPVESVNSLLAQGPLPDCPFMRDDEGKMLVPSPDASFLTIDPAGYRRQSDDNVITAHYVIDNRNYVAEMIGGNWNPGQTVQRGIELALRHEASLIGVESVAYQQSLIFWFTYWLNKLSITDIAVVDIKRPQNQTKERAIRNFIAEQYSKNYYFIRTADRAKFVWQATAYRTGRRDNKDDYMDCPAMGLEVRNQYGAMLRIRKSAQKHGTQARVQGNNTPF